MFRVSGFLRFRAFLCFFSRAFLRPHNVSYRRKLPRPKGAYRVLAKRQPARGARYREVQHVTQRERVWRTRQRLQTPSAELATARCRATDSTLHQRRAQPWAAEARKGGGARWTRSRSRVRRNCWHSSLQRPPTSAARTTSR